MSVIHELAFGHGERLSVREASGEMRKKSGDKLRRRRVPDRPKRE